MRRISADNRILLLEMKLIVQVVDYRVSVTSEAGSFKEVVL